MNALCWMKKRSRALEVLSSVVLVGMLAWGPEACALQLPAEAQWRVAKTHWDARRWDLAAEEFRIFLDHWPEHPKALEATFYLAEALLQQGQFVEASTLYRQLAQKIGKGSPESGTNFPLSETFHPVVFFRLAESLFLASRRDLESLAESRDLFERFCQTWPEHPLRARAWTYLGQIALREGNDSQAVGYFRRSLAQGPEDQLADAARFGLAEALERSGNPEEAERFYFALAHKPSSPFAPQACYRLARLYASQGQTEASADQLQHLLKTWPEHPLTVRGRLSLARLMLILGKPEELSLVLRPVLDHPVSGAEALYWLGLGHLTQKNVASALELFELALNRNPNGALANWIRLRKAEALLLDRKPREALEELEVVCPAIERGEIPPSLLSGADAAFGNQLASLAISVHLALGRRDSAGEIARRVLELNRGQFSQGTLLAVGRALLSCGEPEKAKEVLLRFPASSVQEWESQTERFSGDPIAWEARYWLGKAFAELGDNASATKEWQRLAEQARGKVRLWATMRLAKEAEHARDFPQLLQWASEAVLLAEQLEERAFVAEALYHQAIAYTEMGERFAGREVVARLLALPLEDSLRCELLRKIAHKAMEKNHWDWAAEILEELLSLNCPPHSYSESQLDLAWCEIQLERLAEARSRLETLVRSISEDWEFWPEAWFLLGQAAEQMGDTWKALAAYQQASWANLPEVESEARWRAARLWHRAGELEIASDWYESLVNGGAGGIAADEVLYFWAAAEKARGSPRYREVLVRLAEGFPSSRHFPETILQLAEIAISDKDWNAAERWLLPLLKDSSAIPERVTVRAEYLWAWVVLEQGRPSEAEDYFRSISSNEVIPELSIAALFGLGESLLRQKRFEEALEAYEAYGKYASQMRESQGENSPHDIVCWQALAELRILQILVAMGRWEEGEQAGTQWLECYPGLPERAEVNVLLGKCLYRQGKLTQARDYLAEGLALAAGRKAEIGEEAQLLLAESYFLQGDFRAALREYLRLEILFPKSVWIPAAILQAAKCYERLGRRDEAIRQCRRLVETWPRDPKASEARDLLHRWENPKMETVLQSQW
jgi:TolA-binding protein